ncbi:MAG: collagen binding domain-containing protein [Bradymonadia bacterium]
MLYRLCLALLASTALVACGEQMNDEVQAPAEEAAESGERPVLTEPGGKADGLNFKRVLKPSEVELDGSTREGNFFEEEYVAYTFEVESAQTLVAELSWGWEELLWDAANIAFGRPRAYQSSTLLFRYDEKAPANSPFEQWDLIKRWDSSVAQYDIYEPGQYMVVVLATPAAYEDSAAYEMTLSSKGDLEARTPGDLRLTIVTAYGQAASGLELSLGEVEAVTDVDGVVEFKDVPAGEYTLKAGPYGEQRLGQFFIHGNGSQRHGTAVLTDALYESLIKEQEAADAAAE